MKFKMLKIYIKTNLAYGFIYSFKSPAKVLILFNRKLNGSFHFYVDYQSLNNFTIKNQYLLLLINKSFDQNGWAKKFTQFDLFITYNWIKICESDK